MDLRPRSFVIAGMAAMLLVLSGCSKEHPQLVDANVAISNCVPSVEPAQISEDGQVRWTGDGTQIYTVTFTGLFTPFADDTFLIPANATSVPSGTPDGLARACASVFGPCKYTYTITAPGCNQKDPHVIISK